MHRGRAAATEPLKAAFHIDQLWFSAPGGIGTYVWELWGELEALEGVKVHRVPTRDGRTIRLGDG